MSKAAFAGLKTLQELRFHLCQTSKGSEGVRNFLMSSYKNLKAASPTTPVLIREASGIEGKTSSAARKGMAIAISTSPPPYVNSETTAPPAYQKPRSSVVAARSESSTGSALWMPK